MIVETLAVGTELLLGQIVNSNASEIGMRLADAGLDHFHQTVVGDNQARLVTAILQAADRADAVIITGGIGPTQDDITRDALCAAAGTGMVFDESYARRLREFWERRGRPMPDSNLRQAEHPEGSVLIMNPRGTAPGLRMRVGDAWAFALPGVPAEMLPMLESDVIPFLVGEAGGGAGVLVSRVIRSWGESESKIAEMLADVFEASTNPTVAFLASSGEIKVRLTARADDEEAAAAVIDPVEREIRSRLGARVFAVGTTPTEQILLDLAAGRGWTIATAESVTGGLISARLTSIPGASATFRGSIIAYGEEAKAELLGVDPGAMARDGVVSEPTALAMAEGVAERLGAEVAIATTGSAGPEPLEQPAGTVVVAVQTPEGARARTLRMPASRERVRTFTTTSGLHLARLAIEGTWWGT